MLPRIVWIAVAAVLLAGCTVSAPDPGYDLVTLVLPDGHPDTGRQTFARMKCSQCHEVTWEVELAPPLPVVNQGPALDARLIRRSIGSVATSIVAPSYHTPEVYRERTESGMSPMADFSGTLTVRELVDIVAYLRTQGGRVEPVPPGLDADIPTNPL